MSGARGHVESHRGPGGHPGSSHFQADQGVLGCVQSPIVFLKEHNHCVNIYHGFEGLLSNCMRDFKILLSCNKLLKSLHSFSIIYIFLELLKMSCKALAPSPPHPAPLKTILLEPWSLLGYKFYLSLLLSAAWAF